MLRYIFHPDGSFDIYINSLLSPARRQEILEHELNHIRQEHFYLDMPISLMERQANGEHVNVVLHPPEGYLLITPIPGLLDDDFDSEREEE